MKKKQMMMALVSLMVLSAQAQANFQVSVSNPSKVARTDAPVVVDLSKLGAIGNIQRAVVTDRKSTRLNSSHLATSRMPSAA